MPIEEQSVLGDEVDPGYMKLHLPRSHAYPPDGRMSSRYHTRVGNKSN